MGRPLAMPFEHAIRSALSRTRRRRLHCLCLGAAKTGTTSFAGMFAVHYRAAHEPATRELLDTTIAVIERRTGGESVERWLVKRDRRLWLEVEASHPLGYFAPWLPRVFPDARFVITLRDPLSWLASRLNYHYFKSPPLWADYRRALWSRFHSGHARQEEPLARLGLYSLDAYLRQYAEQYELLLGHLPAERRLLLNTAELDAGAGGLAGFLRIPASTIVPRHDNALPVSRSILEQLPKDFVAEKIEQHCSWLLPWLRTSTRVTPVPVAGVGGAG